MISFVMKTNLVLMKKKSITYTDLSKKQLQHLKELYIQKKV